MVSMVPVASPSMMLSIFAVFCFASSLLGNNVVVIGKPLVASYSSTNTKKKKTLPDKVFWDNNWPSDLVLPSTDGKNKNDNDDDRVGVADLWSLDDPIVIEGQSALDTVGDDSNSAGLLKLYNDQSIKEVLAKTWNGAWVGNIYLPSATDVKLGSKFQIKCSSTWGLWLRYNDGVSKRIDKSDEFLVIVLDNNDGSGPKWMSEDEYIPPPSLPPTIEPTSAPTPLSEKQELLEGTVLFGQAGIIPSKNRVEGDTYQPHLTAQRKTLVMMKPHNLDDADDDDDDEAEIIMTVRDKNGDVLKEGIVMKDPSQIPKQAGWIELGDDDNIDIPDTLSGDRYVIQYQSNLDTIGNDPDGIGLRQFMNASPNNNQIEIKTWNGSWVRNIYLPDGKSVPSNTKVQITCNSGYSVNLFYPNTQMEDDGAFRSQTLKNGQKLVAILVDDGKTWITEVDLVHSEYVFGHNFYTSTLDAKWVSPGMSLEFAVIGNEENDSRVLVAGEENPEQVVWSLEEPYYVINSQNDLDQVGEDSNSLGFMGVLTKDDQFFIRTSDGSWKNHFYLPNPSLVALGTKIQFVCESTWGYTVHYDDGSSEETVQKRLDTDQNFFLIALKGGVDGAVGWYTEEMYVPPPTSPLVSSPKPTPVIQKIGVLDDIEIGAVTELMITMLDAGFLTPPRNQFTFKDNHKLHREYFETTAASRLIAVEYESMHLTEIMLPTGKFYPAGSISDDDGGWHSGDMRQSIGKILLSHGIDLANYGISSSNGGSESSHPFTCALLAAHNTVGLYQNGRITHGGSGGNGMVTLDSSLGNEFSHEVGHNHGLGHYVDGFEGSVHRPAEEINSGWGWDSQMNVFIPNFYGMDSGKETCLPEPNDAKCQPPFMGRYQYGTDSMAGGSPHWPGALRYTMYTPNTMRIIQNNLEGKAVWDPSSSTGYSKYDKNTKTMKEYTNYSNGRKVPKLFRVPVTTIVGYYDPDKGRELTSYIYPAMHGAYGFIYDDDKLPSSGTSDGCELTINTKNNGVLVYELSTSTYSQNDMNKFHVNVAQADEPTMAKIYCYNELRVSRTLDGPKSILSYTLNGVPFDDAADTVAPTSAPTTKIPTNGPTSAPTTKMPTNGPTSAPTTKMPTNGPTSAPTTKRPTNEQTSAPTTRRPTNRPTSAPTTRRPTNGPTSAPTMRPTTKMPTNGPTSAPTTRRPTNGPTSAPTTRRPSNGPTSAPTMRPTTKMPTNRPTSAPTTRRPTNGPTSSPTTKMPTNAPTKSPTVTDDDECEDSTEPIQWKRKKTKTCVWVGRFLRKRKPKPNKVKIYCKRKDKTFKKRVYDWCPTTCGQVGLGECVTN